ncbi:MAG TPA: ATP-grasp domain-containing protein [Methylophaga sp.]|nr:ATP-grasp domain-containing protein [Methylophaga sp.]
MPSMAPVNWSEQSPKPLILIAAQSGRFLAQMAARAGYPVRVADQFADKDTLAIVEHHLLLPEFHQLSAHQFLQTISELANNQQAILIIGTGLERFFNCLAMLPANIQSANNLLPALHICLTPSRWFALLSDLAIRYPLSQFSPPANPHEFLQKQSQHWGGSHIQRPTLSAPENVYYQQKIQGRSGSVLFIAAAGDVRLISLNQQYCRAPGQDDYQLLAVTNRLEINDSQQQWLLQTCKKLSQTVALRGYQSLDFIIDGKGQIWLLELNPRPSASLQCLPTEWPLMDWHLQACQGQLPKIENLPVTPPRVWYCCYANQDLTIPVQFDWPEQACDLPAAGTHFIQNQVICSLQFAPPSEDVLQHGQNLATQLQLQLQNALEKPLNSAI